MVTPMFQRELTAEKWEVILQVSEYLSQIGLPAREKQTLLSEKANILFQKQLSEPAALMRQSHFPMNE